MNNSADAANRGISQTSKRALRNPWVLGWIALVVIVLGVNGLMISLAVVTNPGLVNNEYYEKGQHYERTVQSRMAEKNALGWEMGLQLPEAIQMAKPAAFRLVATDKIAQPLAGASVMVRAFRPADADADFAVPLAESASGLYVGDVVFPLKGVWDLIIEVQQGEHAYQIARRVSVLG